MRLTGAPLPARLAACSGVGRQPGVEIGHALNIEQGLRQGFQPLQRQAANPVLLCAERATKGLLELLQLLAGELLLAFAASVLPEASPPPSHNAPTVIKR